MATPMDLFREVYTNVTHMIADALARHRPNLEQAINSLPPSSLPATGNTGEGYTPAPHTHAVDNLRGTPIANVPPIDGYVLAYDGEKYTPTEMGSGGGGGSDSHDAYKLRGRTVSTIAPEADQVLSWNDVAEDWRPTSLPTPPTPLPVSRYQNQFLMSIEIDTDKYVPVTPVLGPRGWLHNDRGFLIVTTGGEG